ncbi:hypothetical protein F5883DRAFT_717384 [Diaporthe sp. PMI_573]|nr:hypothetical protein F5883DRAFT_717384 [Diaporthaceae sp. PMI_573]
MGFLQVGFEITRLPKDTNLSTPMFPDKMANNDNMANTNDSTTGIRVGIGASIFQVAGSVCSDRSAMATLLSGVYVVAACRVAYGMVVPISPLAATAPGFYRPIIAVVGTVMASAFTATVLPKPNNDRSNNNGATRVVNPKSP